MLGHIVEYIKKERLKLLMGTLEKCRLEMKVIGTI